MDFLNEGSLETSLPIDPAKLDKKARDLYAVTIVFTIILCKVFDMSSLSSKKEIISLSECPNTSLKYVFQQRENGNEVVFWLKINQEALSNWRRENVSGTLQAGILYIDLVNLSIPGNAFRLNRKSERLETVLSNSCIVADAKRRQINKKGSPRQRQEFLDSYKKVAILRDDITSVEEWELNINSLEHKVDIAEAEIKLWKQKYHDIEKEKQDLLQERLQEKELVNSCKQENELMKKYIRQLEKDQFSKVRGTAIPKLKTAQAQNKKLKELKTRAQKALYFSKLFGLELDCLRLKDPDSSKTYTVDFNIANSACLPNNVSQDGNSPVDPLPNLPSVDPSPPFSTDSLLTPPPEEQSHPSNQTSCQSRPQYAKLSEDDKAKVESILYLIDKFGVGDEFIHELSMTVDGMPKSYLIKQCRKDLNGGCFIKSTPGKAPGAQYSFKELLVEQIKHMVCPKYYFLLHVLASTKKEFFVCLLQKQIYQ